MVSQPIPPAQINDQKLCFSNAGGCLIKKEAYLVEIILVPAAMNTSSNRIMVRRDNVPTDISFLCLEKIIAADHY